MEFESFEQALHSCMTLEDGSSEQKEAMIYCLKHAPADLRAMLGKRLGLVDDNDNHDCGCGCNPARHGRWGFVPQESSENLKPIILEV